MRPAGINIVLQPPQRPGDQDIRAGVSPRLPPRPPPPKGETPLIFIVYPRSVQLDTTGAGLGWAGLGWAGLGWAGLGWIESQVW